MINQILINLVFDRENGFEEPEQKNVPTLIKNALKYINENLDKPLTTHGIAKALFVSKDHLCHAFSKTLNTGIMQFVSIKRAYKARSMIKSGIPAVTVSEKLGYAYYSTFLRNYKSHFGITPSEEKVDG
jgi:AraC-like DNA-binding protein